MLFNRFRFKVPFKTKGLSWTDTSSASALSDIIWYNSKRDNFPIAPSSLKNYTIILPRQKMPDSDSLTTDFSIVLQSYMFLRFLDKDENVVADKLSNQNFANYSGVTAPNQIFAMNEFDAFEFAGLQIGIGAEAINPSELAAAITGSELLFCENIYELKKDFKEITYRQSVEVQTDFGPDNYITIETKKKHGFNAGQNVYIVGLDCPEELDASWRMPSQNLTIDKAEGNVLSGYMQIYFYGSPLFTEAKTKSKGFVYP